MLELEDAVARILSQLPAVKSETVPIAEAHGRFATGEVRAQINLPPFDNSSMDGYAVRAADVANAIAQTPVKVRLVGRIAAGQQPGVSMNSGEAVRVFTGSALPSGSDAVVMQEDTRVDPADPDTICILDSAKPWENVRFAGEDVKRDAIILKPGEKLTASRGTLLAATGVSEVAVAKLPHVGLLATGTELREAGGPLEPGQIYESNRAALAPLVRAVGGVPDMLSIVKDDPGSTRAALEAAFAQSDIVITCGGVSVGEMDFVRSAFESLGGKLDFWKVAIKPGRPFVFGQLGSKYLFGLPGNPVSAFVTFLLLVRPALLHWQGAAETGLRLVRGELAQTLSNPGSRRHFVRVRVTPGGEIHSAGMQASHALSSLAASNALLDMKPGTSIAAGELVSALSWD